MRKAKARAVAETSNEDRQDFVLLWSAGLWLAALIYVLGTFSIPH